MAMSSSKMSDHVADAIRYFQGGLISVEQAQQMIGMGEQPGGVIHLGPGEEYHRINREQALQDYGQPRLIDQAFSAPQWATRSAAYWQEGLFNWRIGDDGTRTPMQPTRIREYPGLAKCAYCGSHAPDDRRGNCSACGGPR